MKTTIFLIAAVSILAGAALADDHVGQYGGESRAKPLPTSKPNATWRQECGSCHIAYAPGLLPAESWRKVMAGLDKHFGSDASLTAQENRAITEFLVDNAATRWRTPGAPLRITETAWFKRQHDGHEIRPEVWKRASVKSPANCAACHPGADKGDFEEDRIRIPR
ncbi:MAG: cytochrome C [Hydrogenophilales bacterium 28-61-23]|nr:MAG: cytochrome C [Hydrogenophilales bacterium 28-61-23]